MLTTTVTMESTNTAMATMRLLLSAYTRSAANPRIHSARISTFARTPKRKHAGDVPAQGRYCTVSMTSSRTEVYTQLSGSKIQRVSFMFSTELPPRPQAYLCSVRHTSDQSRWKRAWHDRRTVPGKLMKPMTNSSRRHAIVVYLARKNKTVAPVSFASQK